MNKKLLALACLGAFALAACTREPAEPVADRPAAAEPADTAPTTAPLTPTGQGTSSEDAGFDIKGFAGTFSGTLPCADCPGIDTTLVLDPDGSYVLTEVYQDSPDGRFETDGTWTAEADGTQIRLDPNSKSERDRLYAITSDDELAQLDLEGEPIESSLDYSLQRQAAGGE